MCEVLICFHSLCYSDILAEEKRWGKKKKAMHNRHEGLPLLLSHPKTIRDTPTVGQVWFAIMHHDLGDGQAMPLKKALRGPTYCRRLYC